MGTFDHCSIIFLSTPSVRRATIDLLPNLTPEQFLSTPSVRRATSWPSARLT